MASLHKRLSLSSPRSRRTGRSQSPLSRLVVAPNSESEEWVREWEDTMAHDLIECPVVEVEASMTVEDACDLLLSKDIPCVAVKAPEAGTTNTPYCGLFDFADVNAFLTFAATRHTFSPLHLEKNPKVARIVEAAKAGKVPVHLVSNLSEKNPLVELPHDASIVSLLGVFSSGAHRVLIKSSSSDPSYLGIVSDRRLLSYFASYARARDPAFSSPAPSPSYITSNPPLPVPGSSPSLGFFPSSSSPASQAVLSLPPYPVSPIRSPTSAHTSPSFLRYISTPLSSLPLPSLNLYSEVMSVSSTDSVLDAMRLMSEQGVSCVAVLQEDGGLLSAISVTDIGKVIVPAQNNQILGMPMNMLISQIKMQMPDGWVDGADRYPVYSVSPSSTLSYTMQKLIATNTHRVFVTAESPSSGVAAKGNLSGIVSIVDILSLFARVANLPDVDPGKMKRHRRASSVSSQSSDVSGASGSGLSTSAGSLGDLARTSSRGSIGGGRR